MANAARQGRPAFTMQRNPYFGYETDTKLWMKDVRNAKTGKIETKYSNVQDMQGGLGTLAARLGAQLENTQKTGFVDTPKAPSNQAQTAAALRNAINPLFTRTMKVEVTNASDLRGPAPGTGPAPGSTPRSGGVP